MVNANQFTLIKVISVQPLAYARIQLKTITIIQFKLYIFFLEDIQVIYGINLHFF